MSMDLQFLNWLQEIRTPLMDQVMTIITTSGNVGAIWLLLVVGCLCFAKTRWLGVVMFFSILLAVVISSGVIKPLVARPRPFSLTAVELLIHEPKDFSFPSGHTAVSFAAAFTCYLLKAKKLWIFSLILAVMMAFSRMYVYVHYPTDVIAGALIGCLSAWGSVHLFQSSAVKKRLKNQ